GGGGRRGGCRPRPGAIGAPAAVAVPRRAVVLLSGAGPPIAIFAKGGPRGRGRADDGATMSVVEHLAELRRRLFVALGAVAVGATVGFVLYGRILRFLQDPYCQA